MSVNERDETGAQGDGNENGTTDEDYRARWLSTVFTLVYGLGFPGWAMAVPALDGVSHPGAGTMAPLVTVWIATVIYIIGPENIKAAKSLRD